MNQNDFHLGDDYGELRLMIFQCNIALAAAFKIVSSKASKLLCVYVCVCRVIL